MSASLWREEGFNKPESEASTQGMAQHAEPVFLPPFSKACSFLKPESPEVPPPPTGYVLLPGDTILHETELLAHLTSELDVSRLNRIHNHLWIAGSRSNIRPLHSQRMRQRLIVATERTDLHLIWWDSVILIKPLPPFLLSYDFFETKLCSSDIIDGQHSTLHASACGLLRSYIHLVSHPSDLKIALELGLLPAEMTWKQWTMFTSSIRVNLIRGNHNQYPHPINKRYIYGELRRTRLNLIYRFACHKWMRGYHCVYTEYQPLFETNFAWLILAFAYITVVLSAMQVVLATSFGQAQISFEKASYGFAVGSLVAVVSIVVIMGFLLVGLFLNNLVFTLTNEKKKAKGISIS